MRQFEFFTILFMSAVVLSCGVFLVPPIAPMLIAIIISAVLIYLYLTCELISLLWQTKAGRFLRCLPVLGGILAVLFFVAGVAFKSDYYLVLGILAIFLASLLPPIRLRLLLNEKRDDVIDIQYAYGVVLMLMSTPAVLMCTALVIMCLFIAPLMFMAQ